MSEGTRYLSVVLQYAELTKISAHRLASQIDDTSWESGEDFRFQGPYKTAQEVCEEAKRHGFDRLEAKSDRLRTLTKESNTAVIRIPNEKGYTYWVIPSGAGILAGS